jgi:hypothetical protein
MRRKLLHLEDVLFVLLILAMLLGLPVLVLLIPPR